MAAAKAMISVVDDDASVRKALSRLMKAAGYQATTYPSAEEFLAADVAEQSDCLILDVNLPGQSGLELQAALVHSQQTLPIVFISAYSEEHARAQAIESGANAFLAKPLDTERLLEAIETAIAASQRPDID